MIKYVNGWFAIASAYALCFFASATMCAMLSRQPIDRYDLAQVWIGAAMLVVPYALAGLYVYQQWGRSIRQAFAFGLTLVMGERLGILFIGSVFVAAGGDGGGNGIVTWRSVIDFVWAEALPYFTPIYICCGGISIVVCVVSAVAIWPRYVRPGQSSPSAR
ncbi:hypothetical protein [Paenibacillus methanolicus]|uniref:Uncharacterized protein n=1 Tax=Paenibacillus methanolicus TaxID=582686 RepID=A0A5S5BPR2_9BACL|nr:hypothetical protein [Paenibacillus methanolicus]TYP68944.1 hypothetical protein BCM02_11762 [Paenibacillus methanolicus]